MKLFDLRYRRSGADHKVSSVSLSTAETEHDDPRVISPLEIFQERVYTLDRLTLYPENLSWKVYQNRTMWSKVVLIRQRVSWRNEDSVIIIVHGELILIACNYLSRLNLGEKNVMLLGKSRKLLNCSFLLGIWSISYRRLLRHHRIILRNFA